MLKKTLHMVAFGVAFLIPFVPLIVSSSMFFPYITGKAFAFRILVEIGFAAWLGLMILEPTYRPKRSLFLTALGVFVLVVGLADAFGVNMLRSFWSNYERMEGFITILHLAAYALMMSSLLQKEKQWLYLWCTSVLASIFVSINAFSQLADGKFRVDGTLGNATYLAVYLLFHIFFLLWLLYRHRKEKLWATGILVVLALEVSALYYTGTRGTLLGLVGGLGLAALLTVLFGREYPRVRMFAGIGVVAIVVCIGSFFGLRTTALVQDSPILSRFANISLQDDTTQSRLTLWSSIALPAVKERPLLGWGQDNFIIVFGKYYDPIMYKQEPWFDRAHNVFVDWLVAGGVLGLLAYLFLFGAGLWLLWKNNLSIPEKALLTGLFAGYAIHNFFVFDNLVSYIFFFMVLAWLHSMSMYKDGTAVRAKEEGSTWGSATVPNVAVGVIAILALWMVWSLNIQGITRAQAFLEAIRADQGEQNYAKAYQMYDVLLSDGWLGKYEMREQFTQMTVRAHALVPTDPILPTLEKRSESELLESVSEDFLSTRPLAFLGYMHLALGNFASAQTYTEKALAFNDTRQVFLYDLGESLFGQHKIEEALAAYKKAYIAETSNMTAFGKYAGALMRAGRVTEAETLLKEYNDGAGAPPSTWIAAYRDGGQYTKLETVYRSIIAQGNAPADAYVSLAYVLLRLGNRAGAVAELKKVLDLFPSDFDGQIQGMISTIEAGKDPVSWQ